VRAGEIEASRCTAIPVGEIFAFLQHLPNHWRLEPRFAEVETLGPTAGLVRVRGPVGLSRTIWTTVDDASAPDADRPARLAGTARAGRGTIGRITWVVSERPEGSQVTLTGRVESASAADRCLLALGAGYWLREIFRNALANLPGAVRGEPLEPCATRLDTLDTVLTAGAVGALLSGIPSTAIALGRGDDPLGATLAAGSILVGARAGRGLLLAAAVPVHASLSLFWAAVLARALPPRRTVLAGAVAGVAIAALDLGVAGRLFPRIRALRRGPQLADHAAFGMLVGAVVARRRP
jgi:hypothetical protein